MCNDLDTPINNGTGNDNPNPPAGEIDIPPKSHPSIPAGIKYGLFGMVLFVIAVGAVVVTLFSQPELVEEAVAFDQATLSDMASQESPDLTMTPPAAIEPSTAEQASVEEQTIDRLNAMALSLQQALDQSSSLVAKQRDAAAHQGSSIQEVMAGLERSRALITEAAQQVNDLNTRLTALESRVGQNQDQLRQIKTQTTRNKRPARPAFQLLSIDQWGDRDSVVLALQDQTTVAAIGDTRAGWSIQSIDRPNCIGVVRLSDKYKAKVCKRS